MPNIDVRLGFACGGADFRMPSYGGFGTGGAERDRFASLCLEIGWT